MTRWALWGLMLGVVGCNHDWGPNIPGGPLRVVSNPYEGVEWQSALRLKVQLHDHVGTDTAGLKAYDRAGYDAMSLMHYSGAPALSYAWTARRWPADLWLPPGFTGQLQRIRTFFPNAEEVGADHLISPFLTSFVSRTGGPVELPVEFRYETTQECIDVVRAHGGLVFIAHPWFGFDQLENLRRFDGVEMYSAFAKYRDHLGESVGLEGGWSRLLVSTWDKLLAKNPEIWGIAVNDHYGPAAKVDDLPSTIRDSGKIIVFATDTTAASLKESLGSGRFVAVADLGSVKDRYPVVDSVVVTDSTITVATTSDVRWISNGHLVSRNSRLRLATLPVTARYVRAELRNAQGSVTYAQPFGLGRDP